MNFFSVVADVIEKLNCCSYPTVDLGTAPSALPQAEPAPWPGQSCK